MRTNSHSNAYVWTGEGRITTQSGTRYPIDSDHELARPFIADHGWLDRRPEIAKLCVPLAEWNERKAKPTPAKVEAVAEEKPKAVPPKKRKPTKAKPKAKSE